MTIGEKERAQRKAKEVLDEWLEVTGAIGFSSSWYYELCSVLDDAVEFGAKSALGLPLKLDSKKEEQR